MAPTTLSAVIGRLERKGHVERASNPGDRRSYLLELTDLGIEAWRANGRLLLQLIGDIDGRLERAPDDVRAALADLDRALRRVAADRAGAPGSA